MQSILTVNTVAATSRITTLERVKLELSITDGSKDALLLAKIDEASSDIEAYLGYRVARESVTETFWHEPNDLLTGYVLLDRTPVAAASLVITVDDTVFDATHYRLDANTGQLFALDQAGYPSIWYFIKQMTVAYDGGYLLPGQSGRDLPYGIEGAAIDLLSDYWFARGRDPSIRSEAESGIYEVSYWVGAVGEGGELPPRVLMKLAPYRRVTV